MSEKKPPMSGPMTPERLAEIRDSLAVMRNEAPGDVPTVAEKLLDADIPDLFAEVERLRADLAASRRTAAVFWNYVPEDLRKEVEKLIAEAEGL